MNDNAPSHQLLYWNPARTWDEALPLGNGRWGVMAAHGLDHDILHLNDDTLWSGIPRDHANYEARRHLARVRDLLARDQGRDAQDLVERHMLGSTVEAYQPAASIHIHWAMDGNPDLPILRTLDLDKAMAEAVTDSLGYRIRRSTFASNTHGLVIHRLQWEGLALNNLSLDCSCPHPATIRLLDPRTLEIRMRMPVRVVDNYRGDHPGAVLYEDSAGILSVTLLSLRGASMVPEDKRPDRSFVLCPDGSEVELRIAMESDYQAPPSFHQGIPDHPPSIGGRDPGIKARAILESTDSLDYIDLEQKHQAAQKEVMDRCAIILPTDPDLESLDTAERLEGLGRGRMDPGLEALYFRFGRYLLHASSRPGTQAANLQGIWNPWVTPPWMSDYTLNINTPMNYWPGRLCNLVDNVEPLVQLTAELAREGRRIARIHYGCRGWTCHHNTDLWRQASPTDGDASWALWPLGGAWLCTGVWDWWQVRQDPGTLRTLWPLFQGAMEFLMDWLGSSGNPPGPSTSPENRYVDAEGRICALDRWTTLDLSLARELGRVCSGALDLLERHGHPPTGHGTFHEELRIFLTSLPPIRPDAAGRIPEWSIPRTDEDPGHRHFSHLFGLFPGTTFRSDPELREAARASLEHRLAQGGGTTGWSTAWAACLYAVLGDGAKAHQRLTHMLSKHTLPNLFDSHPPFQIDGNFGAITAMALMLVQESDGLIRLLPALPPAWPEGTARGLTLAGGHHLDLRWSDGQLCSLTLYAAPGPRDGPGGGEAYFQLHYRQDSKSIKLPAGASMSLSCRGGTLEPGEQA